ncbi:MAG: LPXTG cell wall anchor domain-containing protein [Clostridia bacterium]|nr:LPXTG cell wall anchor domain-containing protein [Clostridia bacterium]
MKRKVTAILFTVVLIVSLTVPAFCGSMNLMGGTPADITAEVRKTSGVAIDGVISPGEYDKLDISTDEDSTFLNLCFGSGAVFENAENMLKTMEYYASWTDGRINIAVRNKPTKLIQEIGVKNGEYTEDYFCQNVAYTISSDITQNKNPGTPCNFYFAICKRTDTGEYQLGYYGSDQWGNSNAYKPVAGVDFAISYDYSSGYATMEWSIPFAEICEEGSAKAGDCVYLSIGAEAGEGNGADPNVDPGAGMDQAYAVSLGDFTFLVEGRYRINHASFQLKDEAIGADTEPSPGEAEPADPKDSGAGNADPSGGPAPAVNPDPEKYEMKTNDKGEEIIIDKETGKEVDRGSLPAAPKTGDPMIVLAVFAAASAAGAAALGIKRKK